MPAVVETYFGGQEQGAALGSVLWGRTNPSGKLPVTYPTSETAIPPGVASPWATAGNLDVGYGDRINVGYKGYDTASIKPLFPFGFGLSYTTFRYSALQTPAAVTATTPIHVKFKIANTQGQRHRRVTGLRRPPQVNRRAAETTRRLRPDRYHCLR